MATKLLPVAVASTAAAFGVVAGAGGRKSRRGKGAPDPADPAWAGSMHMVAMTVESGDANDRDGAVADSDEEAAARLLSPPPPAAAHG